MNGGEIKMFFKIYFSINKLMKMIATKHTINNINIVINGYQHKFFKLNDI